MSVGSHVRIAAYIGEPAIAERSFLQSTGCWPRQHFRPIKRPTSDPTPADIC